MNCFTQAIRCSRTAKAAAAAADDDDDDYDENEDEDDASASVPITAAPAVGMLFFITKYRLLIHFSY